MYQSEKQNVVTETFPGPMSLMTSAGRAGNRNERGMCRAYRGVLVVIEVPLKGSMRASGTRSMGDTVPVNSRRWTVFREIVHLAAALGAYWGRVTGFLEVTPNAGYFSDALKPRLQAVAPIYASRSRIGPL
jgi:hypothetical protein